MGNITVDNYTWIWTFFDVLLVLFLLYDLTVWGFAIFPLTGIGSEPVDSGATDPTVLKWLILVLAAVALLFLPIHLFLGYYKINKSWRWTYHFVYYLLALLLTGFATALAFLWDDRFGDDTSGVFSSTGGAPFVPPSASVDFQAQMQGFVEWKGNLVLIAIVTTALAVLVFDIWMDYMRIKRAKEKSSLITQSSVGNRNSKTKVRSNVPLDDHLW